MARVIDGKAVAATVTEKVTKTVEEFQKKSGVVPGLAVVIIGEDPASQVYVRNKGRTAKACGFNSIEHRLDESTEESTLLKLIDDMNNDNSIHGILVQLPLPKHIDEGKVIAAIAPEKDVDGFHPVNVGLLNAGELDKALVPCTPAGSLILAKSALPQGLSGLNAVVIGRSNIVGKPMAALLLQESCTVTIAHSRTKNIEDVARQADLLVAAVGRPEMIDENWVKEGAVVIDVGINRIEAPEKGEGKTRLVGDVAYESASRKASAITPVPGGVGPMTIAMLMVNTLIAAHRANNMKAPQL